MRIQNGIDASRSGCVPLLRAYNDPHKCKDRSIFHLVNEHEHVHQLVFRLEMAREERTLSTPTNYENFGRLGKASRVGLMREPSGCQHNAP